MSANSVKQSTLYISDYGLVQVTPYYVYEICIYKYWKNGFCLLGSKYVRSSKFIEIKQPSVYKKANNYKLEKHISLIGVPETFVKNLKQYIPIKKKKK